MKPLRTENLNMILESSPVTSGNYLGAYPACIFPKTNKKRYSWISNTHHHGKSGKHWVCWCVNGDKATFFDSYGRRPDDPTLPVYFKTHAEKFKKNYFSKRHICSEILTCFVYHKLVSLLSTFQIIYLYVVVLYTIRGNI